MLHSMQLCCFSARTMQHVREAIMHAWSHKLTSQLHSFLSIIDMNAVQLLQHTIRPLSDNREAQLTKMADCCSCFCEP